MGNSIEKTSKHTLSLAY